MNCVDCAIQFQRMVTLGANDIIAEASQGVEPGMVSLLIKEVFGQKNVFSDGFQTGYKALFSKLSTVGQESVIIVGRLKNNTSEASHHAFNAIRDSKGNWKAVDAQTGLEWTQKQLDETFSYYQVYETIIDNATEAVKESTKQ